MPTLRSVAVKVALLAAAITAINTIIRPIVEIALDEWDRRGELKRKR
jgi:hypothetical protein